MLCLTKEKSANHATNKTYRFIAVILAAVLILACVACSNDANDNDNINTTNNNESATNVPSNSTPNSAEGQNEKKPIVDVELSSPFISISAGPTYNMVVKRNGELWAWGTGGQRIVRAADGYLRPTKVYLFCDDTNYVHTEPVKVMDDVVFVSAGASHVMVIKTDGNLWGWGINSEDTGHLGDGSFEDRIAPIKIMDDVVFVSAGTSHTMAIKTDGSLWGWGYNDVGQLGDGTRETRTEPIKIMDNVKSVSTGRACTFAIAADNSLWAWGGNTYGKLGTGTIDQSLEGVQLTPIKIMDDVAYVSAGGDISATGGGYAMAIKTDGSLWAWGSNNCGQLGLGEDFATRGLDDGIHTPTKVMNDVVSVSTGGYFAMAIKSDGTMWAWGNNSVGQLGNDQYTYDNRKDEYEPVMVAHEKLDL